jgi:hypothetical protein
MAQIIITDGTNTKSLNPWDLESNPEAWNFITNAPQKELDDMFYKVAASFRAVNKRAIATANVPFSIMKGEEVFDDSTAWENKIKFLPKPKDLLRRISLSLTFHNKSYLLRGNDVLKNTKNLNFLVPTTIREIVSNDTGLLDYFERNINGRPKRYSPDDPDLIKIWLLDHTTELLPSKNTAVQAIFNSTGSIYFADLFIRNFYERGGVKPTVLALKGTIFNEKKEDIERGWSRFLRNISRFSTKIFNAETMDVKPIGAGVDDLKNNEVYRQAIENIALGIGMPTSHLLSDWDSYATATVDYMMWQRDDIFPLCESIADDLNEQVFMPLGLRLQFNTEVADSETQDPVAQSASYQTYIDAGMKPSLAAQIVGLEMPDGFEYEDLDAMAEEKQAQEDEKAKQEQDALLAKQPQTETIAAAPAKWIPSLDEFKELDVWRDVALRRHKKGDGLDFEYQPHYGGLPVDVAESIKAKLLQAVTPDEIKSAFVLDLDVVTTTPIQSYKTDPDQEILMLVDALNKLSETTVTKVDLKPKEMSVVVNNVRAKPPRKTSMASAFLNSSFAKKGVKNDITDNNKQRRP